MSEFVDPEIELFTRHKKESLELEEDIKNSLKSCKKSERAIIEAQSIQKKYNLQSKHKEEIEELEEKLGILY